MYKIMKDFSTPSRRFKAGMDNVPASDIDGPVPVDNWLASGHIARAGVAQIAGVAPEAKNVGKGKKLMEDSR